MLRAWDSAAAALLCGVAMDNPMLKPGQPTATCHEHSYVQPMSHTYRKRYLPLLTNTFKQLQTALAFAILHAQLQQHHLWVLLSNTKVYASSSSITSKLSLDCPAAAALPVGALDEHQGVCKQQQHYQQPLPRLSKGSSITCCPSACNSPVRKEACSLRGQQVLIMALQAQRHINPIHPQH